MVYPFKCEEKWDVHTHTTTSPHAYKKLEKFAGKYSDFVRVKQNTQHDCRAVMIRGTDTFVRDIENNAFDASARIRECDLYHVSKQVLSPTPMQIPDFITDDPHAAHDVCQILNDDLAAMLAEFPERFVGLGALPMNFPELAIKELERIKALGMRGVEINSHINGLDLDDERFFPVFSALNELDLCVFIHPWEGFMNPTDESLKKRMNEKRNWRPWLTGMPLETTLAFDSMLRGLVHERLPNLRVLYAHGGGAFPMLLGRLEHGAYCRPDLFSSYFQGSSHKNPYQTLFDARVYTDSLVHNPWALKYLIDILGSSRIAMGSDYPYPLGEIEPYNQQSFLDPKGKKCPYEKIKGIYPGHMIEHLPSSLGENEKAAWKNFKQIGSVNADGARNLPVLSDVQKENLLFKSAKSWLGFL